MNGEFRSPYRGYDVLDKWNSPSWNDQTREAVAERLNAVPERRFLTQEEWTLLEAITARVLPQPERAEPLPIAPFIDEKLAENRGDGYRYAELPPMPEAWRRGLAGIEAESRERHGVSFAGLSGADQDTLLRAVQCGKVECGAWGDLPPARFFKSLLLKQIVSIYYAHPSAWSEIGFGGPASPRGYARLGPDERDPWEARAEP